MMDEGSNGRSREVSPDKLELRLGPPSKEGRRQNLPHQQQAGAFAVPPPPFGHMRPSNGHYLSSLSAGGKDGSVHQHEVSNGSSQKRVAPASAIGWPPIRSFRKKVITAAASNYFNSKPASSDSETTTTDHPHDHNATNQQHEHGNRDEHKTKKDLVMNTKTITDNTAKPQTDSLYVKINMDGFPIGRKVNLKAHDNYQSLSSAVDQLFRGILPAAQELTNWSPVTGSKESDNQVKKTGGAEKPMAGLLDGTGEYTLVYEDNEGDRVLVGDVPWNMFLSTVKRLRVLKSSELRATRASHNQT